MKKTPVLYGGTAGKNDVASVRRQFGKSTLVLGLLALCFAVPTADGAVTVELVNDTVLDSEALLYASSATYGRAINGLSFQTEALLTHDGYQFATWYHLGSADEDVYIARRNLSGGAWEIMDSGFDLTRTNWDAHNVVAMGISGDGVIHLSWDQHCQDLKYVASVPGAATGATWNASIFGSARSSLNAGGTTISSFTYPRFILDEASGELLLVYRSGCSGGGDVELATYNDSTGLWNNPHKIINGTIGDVYTDAVGSSSTRNAYLNGIDIDDTGRIHMSWTWRESAGGANHDILYAYSDNGGASWRNTNDRYLGSLIRLISSEIYIDDGNSANGYLGELDRRNTIMNQQAQAVDLDNRTHIIMWHADDAHRDASSGFNTSHADYFHYYRNPADGAWTRTELPNDREVGLRPDIAYDAGGNVYVAYVTPGPGDAGGYYTDGDLVIAYASKAANYTDWTDIYTDTRDFATEPLIDQNRLLTDGILSIFIQEQDDVDTGITGTPLHILDFNITPDLAWAGDDLGVWDITNGTDWDTDGDNTGDTFFQNGYAVRFNDDATVFTVPIATSVEPDVTRFDNNANTYTLTGAGLGGGGELYVTGGGTVVFANSTNGYTGDTHIDDGTLALSGAATIANSPNINVGATGSFDVTAATGGSYALNSQELNIEGSVAGNINATGNSIVRIDSTNSLTGDLTLQSGSTAKGVGGITGNLIAQSGGTLQIAPNGATSLVVIYEENMDGSGSSPLNGQMPGITTNQATWAAHADIPDDGIDVSVASGSSATLPLSIANGLVYTLDVSLRNVTGDGDWFALGFIESTMIGGVSNGNRFISDPTTGKAWMLFRGDNSSEANQVFLGSADSGTAGSASWSALNTSGGDIDMRIVLDTTAGAGNFTAAFYAKLPASTGYTLVGGPSALTSEDIGAVGFAVSHSDVAGDVTFFHLQAENPTPDPRILTVNGNATFEAGSTLELYLFAPADHDRLSVTGNINAGGTMEIELDTGASVPQPGDTFDILDASPFTSAFDAIVATPLETGHVWDLRELYTDGVISVLDAKAVLESCIECLWGPGGGLPGGCGLFDQDEDGDVDLFDYAATEACVLAGNGTAFTRMPC